MHVHVKYLKYKGRLNICIHISDHVCYVVSKFSNSIRVLNLCARGCEFNSSRVNNQGFKTIGKMMLAILGKGISAFR